MLVLIKGQCRLHKRKASLYVYLKGDKPREYLENWRPILLMNVAYKIASSCIAERMKKVLPTLISEDQTGFMANRYIGNNTRLTYDFINYSSTNR